MDGAQADVQAARDVADSLPVPLEHILAEVFALVGGGRSAEELTSVLARSSEATLVDPTLLARSRRELALALYAQQFVYSAVQVSGIGPPQLAVVRPPRGPALLQVCVDSRQRLEFARSNHISRQILPECAVRAATTCLLLDPRTARVVRQEERWAFEGRPALRLPLAWRKLNCTCSNAMYRLLGWERQLRDAEAAAARASQWA